MNDMQQLFSFCFPFTSPVMSYCLITKLFDRISSQVMSPNRAPSGDAINRCRDAVDSIQSATSHKYSRDRVELVHLLGSPHIQVSDDMSDCITFLSRVQPKIESVFCHHT